MNIYSLSGGDTSTGLKLGGSTGLKSGGSSDGLKIDMGNGPVLVSDITENFVSNGGYAAVESLYSFYANKNSDTGLKLGGDTGFKASGSLGLGGDSAGEEGEEPGMLGTLLGGAKSAVNWIDKNPEIAKLGGLAVGGIVSGKNARDAQRAAAARDDKSWERQRQAEAEDRQRMNDSIKGLDPIFKGKGPMPALRNRDGSEIIKKGRYQ